MLNGRDNEPEMSQLTQNVRLPVSSEIELHDMEEILSANEERNQLVSI